jgi:hypothetical protein
MKGLIITTMQLKDNTILSVCKLSQVAVAPSSVVAGKYLRFSLIERVTYAVGFLGTDLMTLTAWYNFP